MKRVTLIALAGVATATLAGWFLVVRLPDWFGPRAVETGVATSSPDAPVRKIRARLFYVSEDGLRLQPVERDVPFGASPVEQAEALVREQLQPAPAPLRSALPAGTALRAVFLTPGGDAYVDLSAEATSAHSGGSLHELFSVYAIVNLLTSNLPAIARVQILVDGKEVDSLAGHIDLRHPLPRNDRWSEAPVEPASERDEDAATDAPAAPDAVRPPAGT
ncbi:MAG: GerMN domain-containing protein [Vicinamibacterales bacterium]|nr:GerMN domain-containing protein [Vicinamibacterales bacterium]